MEEPLDKKRKRSITPAGQVPVAQRRSAPFSVVEGQNEATNPEIKIHVPQSEPDDQANVANQHSQVKDLPSSGPRTSMLKPRPSNSSEEAYDRSLDRMPDNNLDSSTSQSSLPEDGYIVPETVTYSLHITFDGQDVPNLFNDIPISLNKPSSYDKMVTDALATVRNLFGVSKLIGRSVNFRQGDCTFDFDDGNLGKHTQGLSSLADWKELCHVVNKLWTSLNHRNVHLNIRREYFGVLTRKPTDESFASAKRSEIWRLMKSAFDRRKYIPQSDLRIIASKDMVRLIITDDPTIESAQKEGFIQEVGKKASKLLTLCVFAELRMACLKELLSRHGLSDDTYPIKPKHRCHTNCGPNFDNLLQCQGGFNAAVFFRPGEHKPLPRETVIPMHYEPKEHDPVAYMDESQEKTPEREAKKDAEEEDSAKQRAHCGNGAYSNVYRVRIEPTHHNLTKDKNAIFAVKEFKDRPLRTGADFNKELKILDELRKYPHDHIVTHLATWTQDGRYYMLFRYAQCNLRQYMSRQSFHQPTKRNILWLLKNFLGLASALRDIHNLSDSSVASQTTANLSAPTQDIRKSGWHHDLKPENILYFKDSENRDGSFHIADFGSGKVHTYRSGSVNTRSPNGTLTYEPPEAVKEGATSRPYDMWSMGCVFLEIMVWAFFDYSCVESFESDRAARRCPGSFTDTVSDDAFWQIDPNGNINLRTSVSDWLKKLEDKLRQRNMNVFVRVLDLVKNRMLDMERQTRISALDLWDTLGRIYEQTKIDLKDVRSDSIPEQVSLETVSPFVPRLSVLAPDRRTPEPTSTAGLQRSEANYGPRTPLLTGIEHLTASPQATSSTIAHRHNRSASGYSDISDTWMGEPSTSNVSHTHAQDGSTTHPRDGRTPDASDKNPG